MHFTLLVAQLYDQCTNVLALALTLSMSVLAYWNSLLCELKMITGDKTMKTGLTKKDIA